uniref:Uncharacterized protein n=1 Tax=Arundo donax TaxID=35708 RepID=A0A0A8XVW3_ARUDO
MQMCNSGLPCPSLILRISLFSRSSNHLSSRLRSPLRLRLVQRSLCPYRINS